MFVINKVLSLLICATALIAVSTRAESAKRLYVEAFTTKAGSEKLREAVVAEVRKLNGVTLVNEEAAADLIVGGGGEIWVKGYRSLNPRSGPSTANGVAVYGGYLSIELRDSKGDTLWSDLVTPSADAPDVAKDLSKHIARNINAALQHVSVSEAPSLVSNQPKLLVTGAGATFPAPVYAKWFKNYGHEHPNVRIDYDSVGSEAGVRRLLSKQVDFGASDSPDAIHDLAPAEEKKYLFFPSVAGAVVPIVNLPGLSETVAFTPEVLAGIYLGKIKKWNDPLVRQANRGVHLPDLDIVVVHRSDGSGTSFAWTDFLSQTNPEWKTRVGAGLAPHWPTGREANGNEGVAKLVKELGGSIGYVEFIYALQNHLNFGKVRNRHGEFVSASLEGIAVATSRIARVGDDLKISIVNSPGEGAYPIASFTWFVIPKDTGNESKRAALCEFLKWMLGPGQKQAAALGYLALPTELVLRESAAISQIH